MGTTPKTIVLVTGANQGIGYEIVKKLCAEQLSYHILLGCRSLEKGSSAIRTLGSPSNVEPIQIDVTSDASITSCVDSIQQEFGRLDILVNNAGIAGRELPDSMPTREKWSNIFNVNVTSVFMLTKALAPLLNESTRPSVIMMSSELGSVEWILNSPHWGEYVPYSGSKAALNNLMANFVKMYPRWKVNSCSPGYCGTSLNDGDREEAPASQGAVNAVRLCVKMGEEEGPNGTSSTKDGTVPW